MTRPGVVEARTTYLRSNTGGMLDGNARFGWLAPGNPFHTMTFDQLAVYGCVWAQGYPRTRTRRVGVGHQCAVLADGQALCWGGTATANSATEPRPTARSPRPSAGCERGRPLRRRGEGASLAVTCARLMMRYFPRLLVLLPLVFGCDPHAATDASDALPVDVLDDTPSVDDGDATVLPDRMDVPLVKDAPDMQDIASRDRLVPLPAVYATENVPVQRILALESTTFAMAMDGAAWAWGNNSNGEMQPAERTPDGPDYRLRPQRIDGIREIQGANACFLAGPEGRGSIYCWGRAAAVFFDFPIGGNSWQFLRVPQRMGTFTDVIGLVDDEFCVRADHSTWRYAARDAEWVRSSVFAGEVLSGPVSGVRHVTDGVEAFPTGAEWFEPGRHRIPGIVQSAGSHSHMCMLLNTGRVMCWGSNTAGQCGSFDLGGLCGERGTGPGRCVRRPTEVPGLTDVVQIAAGSLVTCAVRRDGSVWCWGANSRLSDGRGTLGDGRAIEDENCGPHLGTTLYCRRQPTQIAGIDDAIQVAVGIGYQCAVRRGGQAVCWGLNREGQLGDGTTTDRALPTPVRWL